MPDLGKYPFVRIAIVIVIGLLMAESGLMITASLIPFIVLCLICFVGLSASRLLGQLSPFLEGTTICVIWFCIAQMSFYQADTRLNKYYFMKINDGAMKIVGTITSEPQKGKFYSFTAHVDSVLSSTGQWLKASGKINLSLNCDSNILNGIHNRFRAEINAKNISEPLNPLAFDYKQYCARKNIYYHSFCNKDEFELIQQNEGRRLFQIADKIKKNSLRIIETYLSSNESIQISSAMVLGHKKELDQDLRQIYADTGAMHILAVSGLHIGIIYLIFQSILKALFFNNVRTKLFTWVFSLVPLWVYILIVGYPASAVRAGIMISIVVLSKVFNRQSNTLNTIGLAAVLILIVSPYSIFDIGFQFSFLAVSGIVILTPYLNQLFKTELRWSNKIIGLIMVSIAAQLPLIPFSIYYFNQLSTSFWLSSLIAIPASVLIISTSLLMLIGHFIWTPLGPLSGQFLDLIIWSLNFILSEISAIPLTSIKKLYLTDFQLLITSFLIFQISIIIIYKKRKNLKWLIIGLMIFAIERLSCLMTPVETKVVVYHVSGSSLIDIIPKNNCYTLKSKDLSKTKEAYAAEKFRVSNKVKKQMILGPNSVIHSNNLRIKQRIIQVNDKTICILSKHSGVHGIRPKKLDYLILMDNRLDLLRQYLPISDFDTLIVDGSNNYKTCNKIRELSVTYKFKIHFTKESGAKIIS